MMTGEPLQSTLFYFCRLGDMVMATPLLALLHRRYHQPVTVIGAGEWNGPVYQGNPDVAAAWYFRRHVPFVLSRDWPQVRRFLRQSDPGPIYICERHYRQLPRIRRVLSFSGVNPARCVFITDDAPAPQEHLVDRLLRLGSRTPPAVNAADYPMPRDVCGPRLFVEEADRVELDTYLRARGWAHRRIIIVQPGNHRSMSRRRGRWRRLNTDDKAWPIERWVELARRLHAESDEPLVALHGAPEEIPMLREIQAAAGPGSAVVAGRGLRQLFALCESAGGMISVDTGPAHVAAALSLPLVVMYGAEAQRYWLPRSPTGSPVVGVGGPPVSTRVDQISVDTVYEAWRQASRQFEQPVRRSLAQ